MVYTTITSKVPVLAKKIFTTLKSGQILALNGQLGTGKTLFVRHLVKILNPKTKVFSPTFTIINQYPVKLKSRKILIYHIDLYRLNSIKENRALGLEEFLGKPGTITIIEWADKIKTFLPRRAITINFIHDNKF